jgi:hypothetical protein
LTGGKLSGRQLLPRIIDSGTLLTWAALLCVLHSVLSITDADDE